MTLIVTPPLWIARHTNRTEFVHVHTKCVLCCPVRLTGLRVCLQVCFMSGTGLCIMRPFLKEIHFSLRDVTLTAVITNINLLCY